MILYLIINSWQYLFCTKMASQPVKEIVRNVKPLLSTDKDEAKRRVIQLYKLWYRQIPPLVLRYRADVTVSQARAKLKEEFMKHKYVKDIRLIDMLVVKGHLHFQEIVKKHSQMCHFMYYFKDTKVPQPKNFLSKFVAGSD